MKSEVNSVGVIALAVGKTACFSSFALEDFVIVAFVTTQMVVVCVFVWNLTCTIDCKLFIDLFV